MNNKIKAAVALVVAVPVLALAGCGGNSSTGMSRSLTCSTWLHDDVATRAGLVEGAFESKHQAHSEKNLVSAVLGLTLACNAHPSMTVYAATVAVRHALGAD